MKVTNIGQALMGVYFNGELRWIKPGDFSEGDMMEAEAKLLDGNERLKVEGTPSSATGNPDYDRDNLKDVDIDKPSTSKDQLLVIAAYEQADVPQGDDATKADLIKAIKTKRAA